VQSSHIPDKYDVGRQNWKLVVLYCGIDVTYSIWFDELSWEVLAKNAPTIKSVIV